jgi:hypothetical protein
VVDLARCGASARSGTAPSVRPCNDGIRSASPGLPGFSTSC